MKLTKKQRRYLKKHLRYKPLSELASYLQVSLDELEQYLKKNYPKLKHQSTTGNQDNDHLGKRVQSFSFNNWLNKHRLFLIILTLLVFAAYFNSLFNDFISDDIPGILNNDQIGNFSYVLQSMPAFLRTFLNWVIVNIFGRAPFYFRFLNLLFHLGTVLVTFLLASLLLNPLTAFFGAAILAVHPLQIESVTWISGGLYSQYSFFLLLALATYILSFKDKRLYFLSLACFILSLTSSEKAIVFPFILLALMIAFKSLRNWKKLILPFTIGGGWTLFYMALIPGRITALEITHSNKPEIYNPLIQVPIAITSYLQLALFPKNLTLYHSEMVFSPVEYWIRLAFFLGFLGVIVYGYKKNRQIFFWLSLFLLSLLPTLTPLGISKIVAERYVYLGAIGIFMLVALAITRLVNLKNGKNIAYILFGVIIIALFSRTVIRNFDWKNQDNLWLAAAKTSPSSHQNHNNLGDLYGRQGNLEKAVAEFKTAIQLNPNYADAHHNLANTYSQMGEIELAIEYYQKATELNPTLWQSHQNLAAIYFKQGKFDLSENNLKEAVKISPQDPNLHYNLALVYLKQEKNQQAQQELQIVLQLDPGHQSAQQLLTK